MPKGNVDAKFQVPNHYACRDMAADINFFKNTKIGHFWVKKSKISKNKKMVSRYAQQQP